MRFKIAGEYQLTIPPSDGPSFAAHSYTNPLGGALLSNGVHLHPGVETEGAAAPRGPCARACMATARVRCRDGALP